MMDDPIRQPRSMRFRGRSYIAFVLTPEAPIFDWLADLDAWTRRSTGFFVGKPVVLDLSAVNLSKDAIAHLVAELQTRDIRIMGIEGANPAEVGPELPPVLKGGRPAGPLDPVNAPPPAAAAAASLAPPGSGPGARPGRTGAELAGAGEPGALRPVRRLSAGRRNRAGLGRVRRRNHRRRLYSRLWHAARSRAGRLRRQRARPYLLPPGGSRAARHRRLLSHRRGHGTEPAQPAHPGVAAR